MANETKIFICVSKSDKTLDSPLKVNVQFHVFLEIEHLIICVTCP